MVSPAGEARPKNISPRALWPSPPSWGTVGAGFSLGDVAKLPGLAVLWEEDANRGEKWD